MKIRRIKEDEFDDFYKLLEQDFCFNERKSKSNELLCFKNQKFCPNFIILDDKIINYFCYWNFDDFIFGEHFAILKPLRDKGLGTAFLKFFVENIDKTIIIEVERPFDEDSKRRINFYKNSVL